MPHLALSALGRDRPGIVAAITRVLLDHNVNVEDSQMTILRGRFTMTLIVAVPNGMPDAALRSDLEAAAARLGLDALSMHEVEGVSAEQIEPTHIVSVYGADHPGIVHGVADALATHGWDITDLNTRLVGEDEGEPALYALMVEVAVPDGEGERLSSVLDEVAGDEGVEVTVRELEIDDL